MPACGPRRGFASRPVRPIFISKTFKTLARGQASRGGRHKTSSGAASHGCLARSGDIKAGQTSRGPRDVSHDDLDQAGASARSVLVSSLVLRGQAQARSIEASSKGFHIGATRPRPVGRQDGGHHGAQDGITARAFRRRRPLLSGEAVLAVPFQIGRRCWLPSRSIFGERTRAYISRASHHSRGHRAVHLALTR